MHNSSACAVVTSVDDPLDISSSRPHSQARPDGVRATKQRLLESWGNRYRRRHQISLSVLDRSNWREGGREGRLHAGGLNVIVLVKFYCPHPHTARQMYVPRAPHTAPVRSLHHHVLTPRLYYQLIVRDLWPLTDSIAAPGTPHSLPHNSPALLARRFSTLYDANCLGTNSTGPDIHLGIRNFLWSERTGVGWASMAVMDV